MSTHSWVLLSFADSSASFRFSFSTAKYLICASLADWIPPVTSSSIWVEFKAPARYNFTAFHGILWVYARVRNQGLIGTPASFRNRMLGREDRNKLHRTRKSILNCIAWFSDLQQKDHSPPRLSHPLQIFKDASRCLRQMYRKISDVVAQVPATCNRSETQALEKAIYSQVWNLSKRLACKHLMIQAAGCSG